MQPLETIGARSLRRSFEPKIMAINSSQEFTAASWRCPLVNYNWFTSHSVPALPRGPNHCGSSALRKTFVEQTQQLELQRAVTVTTLSHAEKLFVVQVQGVALLSYIPNLCFLVKGHNSIHHRAPRRWATDGFLVRIRTYDHFSSPNPVDSKADMVCYWRQATALPFKWSLDQALNRYDFPSAQSFLVPSWPKKWATRDIRLLCFGFADVPGYPSTKSKDVA